MHNRILSPAGASLCRHALMRLTLSAALIVICAGSILAVDLPCKLPEGIVSWWQAEDNAEDVMGLNDGMLLNGVSFTNGMVGQAFDFDGQIGIIALSNSPSLNPSASFSIESWIYPREDGDQFLFSKWTGGGDYPNMRSYALRTGIGRALHFAVSDGFYQNNGSFHDFHVGNVLTLNAWQHVAAVYDQPSGTRVIYVNGVEVARKVHAPITVLNAIAHVTIGGNATSSTGTAYHFNGLMDETSFHHSALSSSDVAAIYNAGSAGKCSINPPCDLPEGLAAYYPFSGNADDQSGNGNDGTVLNATLTDDLLGHPDSAYAFAGDSLINCGNGPAFQFGQSNFTMSALVYAPSNSGSSSTILLSKEKCFEQGSQFRLEVRNDRVAFGLTDKTGAQMGTWDNRAGWWRLRAPLPVGTWAHVMVVREGLLLKLYVNGQPGSSFMMSGSPDHNNSHDFLIGARHGCSGPYGEFFTGKLGQVRVYNRALDTTEMSLVYEHDSQGKCAPDPPTAFIPIISQLTPASGTNGSAIVIQGANFSGMAEENIVQFGAVQALVTSANTSSLTVIVPRGATYGPITVTANGLTAYSPEFFLPVSAGVGSPITASSFSPGMNLSAADGPVRVIITDLDNDGRPDLAVGNIYDNTISIYPNTNGPGTLSPASFAPRFELPTGAGSVNPYWIVAADLDGDGRPDLVSTDDSNGRVGIRRNESAAGSLSPSSFGPLIEFPVGNMPRRVVVFDLNGDARPEIITANVSGSISILPNLGPSFQLTGNSFGAAVNLPAPASAQGISVGDLDGDGLPDLVGAHGNLPYVSVFRNLGGAGPVSAATFDAPVQVPVPIQTIGVDIAEVDGDGKLDLITGSYLGQSMSVLRNVATPGSLTPGSFEPHVPFGLSGRAHNVGLGDLNGNGMLDIAMATEISSRISLFENRSTPGRFDNTSLSPQMLLPAGWNAWGVSIGDLDLDGRPDIVFANQYDDTVTLYRNEVPVGTAPHIVAQPESGTFNEGDVVVLSVEAEGTPTLYHQWLKNGGPLPGATNASLAFDPIHFSEAGTYSMVVSNAFGTVISSNAVLKVNRLPIADANATLPLVISPNNSNATLVLDGTLSSDPDGDLLSYTWHLDGNEDVLAIGAVASVNLPVGAHLINLTVDDGMASDTGSITLDVITLSQAADKLLEAVTDSGAGNGQSLIASLGAALASIDRSNPVPAVNQLQAFQNKVLLQVAPEDSELAAQFIQQAQDIIDGLAAGELGSKHLKVLAHQGSGKVGVAFSGSPDRVYFIEASTDMVMWTMIGTARHEGNGRFAFEDSHADTFPCRFYRVVAP